MARWTEAQIISRISTALNDPATAIWGTATVAAQMELDIRQMSDYIPQMARATVAFAGTLPELSLTSISDWIDIDEVEFPIDQHPKRYVNFSVRGSSVILDSYETPVSTADTAYIWYSAPHTVSGTATNTFKANEEALLVELTAAHLMQNLSTDKIEEIGFTPTEWQAYLTLGDRREAKAMARLKSLVKSNMFVRYPDVK